MTAVILMRFFSYIIFYEGGKKMRQIMEFLTRYEINLIFRMVIACVCGVLIGYERKNRAKEAGIRTHCIVACASAMMMIISKYGFWDLIDGSYFPGADVRLDPSRMAQGIITGVGFLGSGMIYIQRGSTKGLTTAAGVWATSGIGMALGAGMYVIGLSSTGLVLLTQFVFHGGTRFNTAHKSKTLKIYGVREENFQETVENELEQMNIYVTDVSITKNFENEFDYSFYLDIPEKINEEELVRKFNYHCSINFTH